MIDRRADKTEISQGVGNLGFLRIRVVFHPVGCTQGCVQSFSLSGNGNYSQNWHWDRLRGVALIFLCSRGLVQTRG